MPGAVNLPAQAGEKTIQIGTMSREDLVPIADFTQKLLEDAGCKVEVTEFSQTAEKGSAFSLSA